MMPEIPSFFAKVLSKLAVVVICIYPSTTTSGQITGFFWQPGHESAVKTVAFSPDGNTLASGSADATIKLWKTRNGTLRNTLSGHKGPVYSVAFSPDGNTLASGSVDKTIKLWDVETGTLQNTLSGHGSVVWPLAFNPDGNTLASGSHDQTIKLWDAETGILQNTLSGHEGPVLSLAFSPNGNLLASGGERTIKLWDVKTGDLLKTLSNQERWVSSVAFSPDGSRLASGSYDHTIKLWNTQKDTLSKTLNGLKGIVYSVAFSPDDNVLASGSSDSTSTITLWNVQDGTPLRSLPGHKSLVHSVAFSPDGSRLASGSYDRTIKLWNPKNGALIRTFEGRPTISSWLLLILILSALAVGVQRYRRQRAMPPDAALQPSASNPAPSTPASSAPGTAPRIPRLFISYAHEDEAMHEEFGKHLKSLEYRNIVQIWHDRMIEPGMDWDQEIEKKLEDADIIVLLISADFVSSAYAFGIEMKRALQLNREGKARVIPVIIRPYGWERLEFSRFQILPTGATPISEWPNQDRAWKDVTRSIEQVALKLRLHLPPETPPSE